MANKAAQRDPPTSEELDCNQAREIMCLQILLDMAAEFYADPENRRGYESWKQQRKE